jgi:TatD DNase family protein
MSRLSFVDTHCHIQGDFYKGQDVNTVLLAAKNANVEMLICVGTDEIESQSAIDLAHKHSNVFASVALHPHDEPKGVGDLSELAALASCSKVIAIGECGLDYYYPNVPKDIQIERLKFHLELSIVNNLPLIFHVRNAFEDFFAVLDQFPKLSGVVHSFTGTAQELSQILSRGLYVGINGIVTFTKEADQLAMYKSIPLDRLLLETDSPFLTPAPFRGKINEPKNVAVIAEFLSELRSESLEAIAAQTTKNAVQLFNLKVSE